MGSAQKLSGRSLNKAQKWSGGAQWSGEGARLHEQLSWGAGLYL